MIKQKGSGTFSQTLATLGLKNTPKFEFYGTAILHGEKYIAKECLYQKSFFGQI